MSKNYEGDLPPGSPLLNTNVINQAEAINALDAIEVDTEQVPGVLDPIATIPVLSAASKTLGDAARAIDELLPTTSLDPYIPNVETVAGFIPGVGDLNTGEYSALDILGLGLDAFGGGLLFDSIRSGGKARKAADQSRELAPPVIDEAAIRRSITRRNAAARDNLNVGTFEPSPEMRAQLDAIGAPSNEEFARMQARIDAGVVPEDMLETASPSMLRALDEEAGWAVKAARHRDNAQKKFDAMEYGEFNINQTELFEEVNLGQKVIKRTFRRNDKSNTGFHMEIHPSSTPNQISVRINAAGRTKATSFDTRMDEIEAGQNYFRYTINHIDTDTPVISHIHLYSSNSTRISNSMRGAIETARLLRDTLDHLPSGAIINENVLTLDSLYLMLNQISKKGQKGKVNIIPSKYTGKPRPSYARVSEVSKPSKLAKSGEYNKVLSIFADIEKRLIDQGKLNPEDTFGFEIDPKFDNKLKFHQFTISDLKAVVPMFFGAESWEEMSKQLDNEDDTINNIIDMESSIFE